LLCIYHNGDLCTIFMKYIYSKNLKHWIWICCKFSFWLQKHKVDRIGLPGWSCLSLSCSQQTFLWISRSLKVNTVTQICHHPECLFFLITELKICPSKSLQISVIVWLQYSFLFQLCRPDISQCRSTCSLQYPNFF